jgi:hypothetical protein
MGQFLERYERLGQGTRADREKYRLQAIEYKCSLYLARAFGESCDHFVARRPDIAEKLAMCDRDIADLEALEVRAQLAYGLISPETAAAWKPSVVVV